MPKVNIEQARPLIEKWIQEGQTKKYMCEQLNCGYDALRTALTAMNISYTGNQAGKGIHKPRKNMMDFYTYLANSKDIQSNKVRTKLLQDGIKEHRCECCGNTEWLGQPIPLELHHIDGNKHHNELSNFQLLCPNCHAFTDSYRGKNCRKN